MIFVVFLGIINFLSLGDLEIKNGFIIKYEFLKLIFLVNFGLKVIFWLFLKWYL